MCTQKEWTIPLAGSCKLSMDASRIERCKQTIVGGGIEDDKGRIDIAVTRLISDVPILVAECIAIGAGIRLARTSKLRNIEVEMVQYR